MQFEVDPALWTIDDARISELHSGKISVMAFARKSKPNDPWVVMLFNNGVSRRSHMMRIRVPTDEERLESERMNRAYIQDQASRYAGLTGRFIFEHQDEFLSAYPELSEELDPVKDIVARERCRGCTLTRKTAPLLDALMAIPARPDRDYSRLEPILSEHAMRRLRKGVPLSMSELPPDSIPLRDPIKLRKQPLEGEPNLTWTLPGDEGPMPPNPTFEAIKNRELLSGASGNSAPRKACPNCTRKHLAQAIVLLGESRQGYPLHRWLAVGHLAEAADEIMELSQELADRIRDERLAVMESDGYMPALMDLIERVTALDNSSKPNKEAQQ